MILDKLYETNFSKTLSSDSTETAKRLLPYIKGLKRNSKVRPTQTEREKYIHNVLDAFSELTHAAENLEYCEIFLNSYSVSRLWRNKYDRNHYIRYHYENWVMNIVRLYERLLILVDNVYELGIPHKEVTYKVIAAHTDLAGTDTLTVINKIHGALNNVQALKNQVFHRYMYDDNELGEITTYEFLARQSTGKDKIAFQGAVKFQVMFYLQKKKAEVKGNNKVMVDIAEALLNTLQDKYSTVRNSK